MDFCYLLLFESTKIGKINPAIIKDDDPKIIGDKLEELGYRFDKPLKRREGFTKIYDSDSFLYFKVIPCLKINDRFFELKELPIGR